ncbi:hypothetical protein C3486_18375 [Streptomyces sp. Ru73]|uniref:sulfite exporter TauE/SafE family protein n=1 Tax=Streptomyces sp. Ru73 TaxID=2080748 RepID=UPI000CDD39F7|nr:sulfite exporter TauE/SafE family protein [Streptomyces sp. Ru73]POX39388.1 hypothetical protein C3486_18375 [Streptomyces sp. Ru73]
MLGLGLLPLLALGAAALLAGFSKTALSGVAAVAVAVFAAVLPAKESTGALLPLLLAGDVIAVRAYRRHADRAALRRLFPSVAAGVLLGAAFTAVADDALVRRTIGALLLSITVHHVRQRRARWRRGGGTSGSAAVAGSGAARERTGAPVPAAPAAPSSTPQPSGAREAVPIGASEAPEAPGTVRTAPPAATPSPRTAGARTALYGLVAGFATMVANAGGPAMSLYLLTSGLGVLGFLGTAAWFFFLVNAFKLPFSAGLGLLTPDVLLLDAVLLPAVLLGARLGRRCIHRLDQQLFTRITLVLTTLCSIGLLR